MASRSQIAVRDRFPSAFRANQVTAYVDAVNPYDTDARPSGYRRERAENPG